LVKLFPCVSSPPEERNALVAVGPRVIGAVQIAPQRKQGLLFQIRPWNRTRAHDGKPGDGVVEPQSNPDVF